jgi:hypothetical protein
MKKVLSFSFKRYRAERSAERGVSEGAAIQPDFVVIFTTVADGKGGIMILPYNWKEKMNFSNIRQAINKNAAVAGIIAAVVIIVMIAYLIRQMGPPAFKPGGAYYFNTAPGRHYGDISIHSAAKYPPLIDPKTGKPTLVLAMFYTCGSCKNKKLVYLQKYTRQAKALIKEKGSRALLKMGIAGLVVRKPAKGSRWYPLNSPQGQRITTPPKCAKLKPCVPG